MPGFNDFCEKGYWGSDCGPKKMNPGTGAYLSPEIWFTNLAV